MNLDGQQGERCDSVESLLLVPVQQWFLLQLVSIRSNFLTACKLVTRLDVIEGEQSFVSVTHVVHSVVDRRAVTRGSEHHVQHDLRHVYLLASGKRFLVVELLTNSTVRSFIIFFFGEERSDSVLSSKLLPGLFRQVVGDLPC